MFNFKLNPIACPSTHPYAFQSGRSCCGSERSGAECRASSFALLLSSSCCENNDQVPCPGGKDNCRSANRHLCYLAGELVSGREFSSLLLLLLMLLLLLLLLILIILVVVLLFSSLSLI